MLDELWNNYTKINVLKILRVSCFAGALQNTFDMYVLKLQKFQCYSVVKITYRYELFD